MMDVTSTDGSTGGGEETTLYVRTYVQIEMYRPMDV
jgi:hypothetical protein